MKRMSSRSHFSEHLNQFIDDDLSRPRSDSCPSGAECLVAALAEGLLRRNIADNVVAQFGGGCDFEGRALLDIEPELRERLARCAGDESTIFLDNIGYDNYVS
jgi:hypothetical protein